MLVSYTNILVAFELLLLFVILPRNASAQDSQTPLTIEQAVATALQKYPAVRVSEADVRGAAAAIQLARTAYLPRLEAIAGVNRATRNNVLGLAEAATMTITT